MVKQTDVKELDILLKSGIITNAEYAYLFSKIEKGKKIDFSQYEEKSDSVAKNILSFILTVIAIGVVLFGTCIMNLAIVDHREYLTIPLIIAWPLFPIVLFGWIAHKTKNTGMKWAVIILVVGALFVIAGLVG
jgi:ABC-type multidrug transport system permease subunit